MDDFIKALIESSLSETPIAKAISSVESSGGKNITPRYEAGFYERYLKNNPEFQDAIKEFGKEEVSSSYGMYQIMYPTAVQYGYKGTPQDLAKPSVNDKWFEIIFDSLLKKTGNLRDTISAYNAGTGGIGTNPEYVEKVINQLGGFYKSLLGTTQGGE